MIVLHIPPGIIGIKKVYEGAFVLGLSDSYVLKYVQTIVRRKDLWILRVLHGDQERCLKLRTPVDCVEYEARLYEQMDFPDLFPVFYGFFTFQLELDQIWGGILMERFDLSVVEFLYKFLTPNTERIFQQIVTNYNAERSQRTRIIVESGIDIESAVIVACVRLLRRLHEHGWVHGDSHLGNFMIKSDTMEICMIDLERSFRTNEPRNQLLDIQEMFGHAAKLTVVEPMCNEWSLKGMYGVTARLHPLNSTRYDGSSSFVKDDRCTEICESNLEAEDTMVFCFLPVCACFAMSQFEGRNEGCIYCRSHLNKKTAKLLCRNSRMQFDTVIESMMK